jgi:N-acylneuraminate cytidylyltransferase
LIAGGKVLAVVTARAGSKGLPRKNLRELGGKPLIAWTIAAGRACRYVDRLVVSTDDREIADVARSCGAEVPFMRPAELAMDDTPGVAPVLHCLGALPGYAWVVLLQPTSPLRPATDIDACLELCERSSAPACVSVVAPSHSPFHTFRVGAEGRLEPLLGWERSSDRRQDLPQAYALNGAVYVARSDWLARTRSFVSPETVAYVMPPERSIDIDTAGDLTLAEAVLASQVR